METEFLVADGLAKCLFTSRNAVHTVLNGQTFSYVNRRWNTLLFDRTEILGWLEARHNLTTKKALVVEV